MKQETNVESKPTQSNGVVVAEPKHMKKLTTADLDTAALMLLHEHLSQQKWTKQDEVSKQIFKEMEKEAEHIFNTFEQESMISYGPLVELYQKFEIVQKDKDNSSATTQPLSDEELKRYILKRKVDRLQVVKSMNTKTVTIMEPSSSYQQKRKLDFTEEELLAKRKKFESYTTKFQALFEQQSSQGFFFSIHSLFSVDLFYVDLLSKCTNTFENVVLLNNQIQPKLSKKQFIEQLQQDSKEMQHSFAQLSKKQSDYKYANMWDVIVGDAVQSAKEHNHLVENKMQQSKQYTNQCHIQSMDKTERSHKYAKEAPNRAKRVELDVMEFWRRNERLIQERRRKKIRDEQERQRREQEMEEAKRQQRKLNFLLTQTELYSHFMAKKGSSGKASSSSATSSGDATTNGNESKMLELPEETAMNREAALKKAQDAALKQQQFTSGFDEEIKRFQNAAEKSGEVTQAVSSDDMEVPTIFTGKLKNYQLKGLSWLVNLYEQGINGILADEMGLGKTIQTIAFLSYLAEKKGIWGPFIIVAPSSTLHNWQHEINHFCPALKSLPYWGNVKERKILRKYWNPEKLYKKDSPFHVLITSYGLILEEEKTFNKVKWQYLILDEAHAIKSSTSARWKTLLNFKCRNRMLLTGTPIQNNMKELWALLHFIMPSLFDSHDEFNEWFSKDIESHAEQKGKLNEEQLSRLHMILKPFMLRRVKKDVELEMPTKTEKTIYCGLSRKQKKMYAALKGQLTNFEKVASLFSSSNSTALMNYVMQFRKVCNHPDLFGFEPFSSSFQFVSDNGPNRPLLSADVTGFTPEIRQNNSNPIQLNLAREVYHTYLELNSREEFLIQRFSIFDKENIVKSKETFNFMRWSNLSPSDLNSLATSEMIQQFDTVTNRRSLIQTLDYFSNGEDPSEYNINKRNLLIVPSISQSIQTTKLSSNSALNLDCRRMYRELLFMSNPTDFLSSNHVLIRDLSFCVEKVVAPPIGIVVSENRFVNKELYHNYLRNDSKQKYIGFSVFGDRKHRDDTSIAVPHEYDAHNGLITALYSYTNGCRFIRPPAITRLIADSSKLNVFDKLMMQLYQEKHRVLIFSQMTKMLDILEDYLNMRHFKFYRLDGSTPVSDRKDMVNHFQKSNEVFAFLLSTRAGGLGITLTSADTVIFYDNDWNPTLDAQAMDRVHRIGQTKPVTVYRIISKGTVEDRILQIAERKSAIQKTVYSGSFKDTEEISSREMMTLLLDEEQQQQYSTQLQQMSDTNGGSALETFGSVDGNSFPLKRKGKKRGPKSKSEKLAIEAAAAAAAGTASDSSIIPDASVKQKKERKRKAGEGTSQKATKKKKTSSE